MTKKIVGCFVFDPLFIEILFDFDQMKQSRTLARYLSVAQKAGQVHSAAVVFGTDTGCPH
jgi:hypothetical protein